MYDQAIDIVEKDSTYISNFSFEFPYLAEGQYTISVAISEGTQDNHIQQHWVHDIYTIDYLSEDKTNKVAAILAFEKNNLKITYERSL